MTQLHPKIEQFYRESQDRYMSADDLTYLIEIEKVKTLERIAVALEVLETTAWLSYPPKGGDAE